MCVSTGQVEKDSNLVRQHTGFISAKEVHPFPREVDTISSGKEKSAWHCTGYTFSHFHQVWIALQDEGGQAGRFSSHEKHSKIFSHPSPFPR